MARFGTAALAVLLTVPLTVRAETAGDPQIEEIVVPGSMIRRDNFDLASPVEVITDLDIEEAGTVRLGDVLVNMAAQSGVSPARRCRTVSGTCAGSVPAPPWS